MIVQRMTLRVRMGDQDRLIELHHTAPPLTGTPLDSRILTCTYGQQSRAVIEFTFADLAACEAYWDAWHALPEVQAWLPIFNASHEGNISTEIWTER